MNTHAMLAAAKRFALLQNGAPPPTQPGVDPLKRPIQAEPPSGVMPIQRPGMRFNPGVQLDPSQVEDRRGMGMYAGPDNSTTTGTIPQGAMAPAQLHPQHLQQLATLFALMQRRMTSPTLAPKTRRRG